ncbi:MAG: hypothetical protein ACREJ2_08100 [Planctomycetota bacterium]
MADAKFKLLKRIEAHVAEAKTKLDELTKTIRDEANAASKAARKEEVEGEVEEAKKVRIKKARLHILKRAEADAKIREARYIYKRWTRRLAKAEAMYKRVAKKKTEETAEAKA